MDRALTIQIYLPPGHTPRPGDVIRQDLRTLVAEIQEMLKEVGV